MPYNYKKLLKKENFSGHINYSAPELIKEDHGFDGKVDVWSLGWCLYYLYTKNDPFEGKTPAIIKKNILTESIIRDKSSIDPIIQELLSACLIILPEERPSAAQLLIHQNNLEYKFYGEVISKATSKRGKIEGGKYEIFGSPQSSYKSYNNNFLPPASIKNKRWSEHKLSKDETQLSSKDENDCTSKEDQNMKPEALCSNSLNLGCDDKTGLKATNNSFNFGELVINSASQDNKSACLNTEPGPVLKNLQEVKLSQDYSVFNEDSSGDYSWFNEDYFIEKEQRVLSLSARRSSTQPSEEDADTITKFMSQLNSNSWANQIENKKINNLNTLDKPTSTQNKKTEKPWEHEIDEFDQLNQNHYVEPNGKMFMGEAIKHGFGVFFSKDPETQKSLTYKGDFKYDLRDGFGQQIYGEGTIYNGSWYK